MERCWDLWRKAIEMRKAERAMAERVELRILAGVMDVWKRRLYVDFSSLFAFCPLIIGTCRHVHQLADDVNDRLVLKHTFRRWQNAQHHVRVSRIVCSHSFPNLFYPPYHRHWSFAQKNTDPGKMMSLYELSGASGKPMNAESSWNAFGTRAFSSSLGRYGLSGWSSKDVTKPWHSASPYARPRH